MRPRILSSEVGHRRALRLLVWGLLFFAACSPAIEQEPTPAQLNVTTMEELVRAPDAPAFEVVFSLTKGSPGGGRGIVVWRQSGGRRRWDLLPQPGHAQGLYLTTSTFPPGRGAAPAAGSSCGWIEAAPERSSAAHSVSVDCIGEKFGTGLWSALSRVLAGEPTERLDTRMIAGLKAECYRISVAGNVGFPSRTAKLCVDAARKLPLTVESSSVGEAFAIEATGVVSSPSDLLQEVNDPAARPDFSSTQPFDWLSLPAAISSQLDNGG